MFQQPNLTKQLELVAQAGHGNVMNNHENLRAHRATAIKEALRTLRGDPKRAPPGLIIVAGSALVHAWALDQGFVEVHTLRPIIEEQDPQRASRLARSGVPSCACAFGALSGGARCTHHDIKNPVVLLVDCLPFLDPAEVEETVLQLGSGNILSVCMTEIGPKGVYDALGTGECWQVVTADSHYAYVCGNNGPYHSPNLSTTYAKGTSSVSFSFLVRCGLSAVYSLGYHQDSQGFAPELCDHNSGYDLVHHGTNQFLAISRVTVNQIVGVLLAPPSKKHDGPARYEHVAEIKVQALLAKARPWLRGAVGFNVRPDSEVLIAGDYPDAHGRLTAHVLLRCAKRTSMYHALLTKIRAVRAHAARNLTGPAAAFAVLGAAVAYRAYKGKTRKVAPPGAHPVGEYAKSMLLKALSWGTGLEESEASRSLRGLPASAAEVVHSIPPVTELAAQATRTSGEAASWLMASPSDGVFRHLTGAPEGTKIELMPSRIAILLAPLYEEWWPTVSLLCTAGHIFNRGLHGHCPDMFSLLETALRAILCLTSGSDSYWLRVALHSIRNIRYLSADRGAPGAHPVSYVALAAIALYLAYRKLRPYLIGQWRKVKAARAGKTAMPQWMPGWLKWALTPSGISVEAPRTRDVYAAQVDLLLMNVPFGPAVVASPGSSVPEYHTDVVLVDRPGWKVKFEEPSGGVYRRNVPIEDSAVGIAAMTFENGLTPRTAISQHPYDFKAMAAGRILAINQRPGQDRSMKLQWAADFFTKHFLAIAEARGSQFPLEIEPFGSPAFDQACAEFVDHFKVASIQRKWEGFLEELRSGQYQLDPDAQATYSIFLKMEAWWKLSSKSDGYLGSAHVGHKPRAIWVPNEKQILLSAITIYQLAKKYKATTKYSLTQPNMNIIYTSSMSGDEVGRRVSDFLSSPFNIEDGSTWFLLLVNGDDNWWVMHPQLTDAKPEVEDSMLQWQTTMREIGRNTEAQARPLYASSFSSSRFLPAMTRSMGPANEETLILTPCWARMAAKLSASLSQLPLRKNGSTDLPTEDGYKMWLRRTALAMRDFSRQYSHDPVGYDLMSTIATHLEDLLGDEVVGPVLDRNKREVMAEEYQHNVTGTYLPHDEYEEAISAWFGCDYATVVEGADAIAEGWKKIQWAGKPGHRYLTSGHMNATACYLIMRGMGETPPTMPGKASKDFYHPNAIQDAQSGCAPGKCHSESDPDQPIIVDEDLQHEHLAAYIVARLASHPAVLFVGAEWEGSRLVESLLRQGVRRAVRYDFWPAGSTMRTVGQVRCKVNNLSTQNVKEAESVVTLADILPDLDARRLVKIELSTDLCPTQNLLPWKRHLLEEWADDGKAWLLLGADTTVQVHVTCYEKPAADAMENPDDDHGGEDDGLEAEPDEYDDDDLPDEEEEEEEAVGQEQIDDDKYRVNGPWAARAPVHSDLVDALAYFADIGVAATLCTHKWIVPFRPEAVRRSKYHVVARESDAAAFDNSTVEESLDSLVGVMRWMGKFDGPQDNLFKYLQRACKFKSKHMTGTAEVCWPSGIPLTSLGGSIMNAMEVIECMRRCLASRGVQLPHPAALASWAPPRTARFV